MSKAVIIFTRVPIMGKTKTRLEKALTQQQCVMAHLAFLKDIFKACTSWEWDTLVFYGDEGSPMILKEALPQQKEFYPQKGGELGEKMYTAILETLSRGYNSCVLIGADIPMLKKKNLQEAFQKLQYSDVVLGETVDGGYYLVGMKKAYKEVFYKQTYSTSTVFENTIKSIQNANLTYSTTATQMDIDEVEDLKKLYNSAEFTDELLCPNTKSFLKSLGKIKDIKERL